MTVSSDIASIVTIALYAIILFVAINIILIMIHQPTLLDLIQQVRGKFKEDTGI